MIMIIPFNIIRSYLLENEKLNNHRNTYFPLDDSIITNIQLSHHNLISCVFPEDIEKPCHGFHFPSSIISP